MASNQQKTFLEDEELCTIEATVVTGFEESARGEAKEKFDTDVKSARGKITWRIPLSKVKDVLQMGSVDNCRVVVHSVPCFKFADQHGSLARLQKMVLDIDWAHGLKAWQSIHNFPHPIASRPEKDVSADDLVDVVIISNQPAPKDKSAKKNKKKPWGKRKDKRQQKHGKNNQERFESGESSRDIQAVSPPKLAQEHENVGDLEDNLSELCVCDENSSKSPVNEKGDANTRRISDTVTSQEENVLLVGGVNLSNEGDSDTKIRLQVRTEGHPWHDSRRVVSNQTANSGEQEKEQEDLRQDESLESGTNWKAHKTNEHDEASRIRESSADSRVSPGNIKISESEFASNVIRRLNSPNSSSKGDTSGADSPEMLCATPPPTPIRSIENPFSNLQDRFQAELQPFLNNAASFPDRSCSDHNATVPGSSVDRPPSASGGKTQAERIILSNNSVPSNISNVPLLSTLANSAKEKSDAINEISTDQSRSLKQLTEDNCLLEENISDGTTPKKIRDPTRPTFRVTCNRTGDSHTFDSSSAAASFGSAIITYLNWQVDLKNFDIEVILNIDDEEVTVSLALTKASLHYRNMVAFGPTTLRATICYNMLRLCRIKSGDFICDPMCGTSAIPIEGALNWANCYHIGGDQHTKAIEKSQLNITSVHEQLKLNHKNSLKLDTLQWDVKHLPLRDKCVDVFVSDLPFGHRVGSRSENRALYSNLLFEMARTARSGARACLLTEDKANIIKAVQTLGKYWQRRLVLNINIGGLTGFVFLLTRTTTSVVQSWTNWRDGEGQTSAAETVSNEVGEAVSSHVQDLDSTTETSSTQS